MKPVELTESFFQGAVSVEKTRDYVKPWRLPFDKRELFPSPNDTLVYRSSTGAGIRVRARTQGTSIGIALDHVENECKFDLTIDNKLIGTKPVEPDDKEVVFNNLPEGDKTVELWLPQNTSIRLKHLLAEDNAEPAPDNRRKWITYGTSITHCHLAHSPARTWPAIVAGKHNLNLTCLGFGGQCHLDPMVAETIRDLPADFISLKISVNVISKASFSIRTFTPAVIGFVRTIREKHPDIPIAVISPIIALKKNIETEPNAVGMTLEIMRSEVKDAVRRMQSLGDKNLYYFSGLDIFGEDLVKDYMPDLIHPDADGCEVMGENFSRVVMNKLAV